MEHYDRGLQKVTQRKEDAAQRFEEAKRRVAEVLPSGTSVMHPYGGATTTLAPELSRRERYRIHHEARGPTSDESVPGTQIRVEKLGV